MKSVMKMAAGLALASMAVAQPVLAAPRAMDAAVSSATAGNVAGVRQSRSVKATNKAIPLPIIVIGVVVAGVGIAAAAGAFDDDPASP